MRKKQIKTLNCPTSKRRQSLNIRPMSTTLTRQHALRHCSLVLLRGILISALCFSSHLVLADKQQDRAQLERLKTMMQALQKELESIKKSRTKVQAELEENEKAIGELSKKATQLETEIKSGEQKLQQLQQRRDHLEDKKKGQEKHLAQHLAAAYRLGSQSHLRLFLNQHDPATINRMLHYYKHVVSARSEHVTSFLDAIYQINEIEPEMIAETELLKDRRQQLNSRRQQLGKTQQQRRTNLATLEAKITDQQQELSKLNKDRSRLEKLLSRVEELIDDIDLPGIDASFASLRGKLPWPSKGKVLHNYGSTRFGNKLKWEGMLISAPPGADVASVHYGRVIFADYLRGHGLLIIVDHGDNYMTLYAHNQALHKEPGEWVNAGDIIATVGNSGGQQQNALYFELRHHGKPQNPTRWLKSV